MYSKIRNLIFKIDPETAHNLAIKSLKLNIAPNIFDEDKKNPMFETELFGKKIDNPIGLAAGFDKNAEVYNSIFNLGFGFVEVGTVTPFKQYGNPKPRVFRLVEDQALINRLGFNNLGAENISLRIQSNKPKGLLGVNLGPNKDSTDRLNDYVLGLKKFHDLADYITINISSPNTENLRDFHDKGKFDKLMTTISNEKEKLNSRIPIVVKISPDIEETQVEKISSILIEHNIKAVIISNTTDRGRNSLISNSRHQKGGLSGKPLEKKSNLLIKKFYNILNGKIDIIGVGGVDSGKSAYEKLVAGSSYLQLYTGMVYQGPSIVLKIKKELKQILIEKKVKNFREIIGKNLNWLNKLDVIIIPDYISFSIMAKKCELTGKNPLKGHKVSHANNKTKRRFLPNLKKVNFRSEILKRNLKLTVSNAGVRSVDKKGTFDLFLKTAKNKNLSPRLKKIKRSLLVKSA